MPIAAAKSITTASPTSIGQAGGSGVAGLDGRGVEEGVGVWVGMDVGRGGRSACAAGTAVHNIITIAKEQATAIQRIAMPWAGAWGRSF